MTNYQISATGAQLEIVESEGILTEGMIGASVDFMFDGAWDGLAKIVVFKARSIARDQVYLGEPVQIPHEVLARPGVQLTVGVYGYDAEKQLVLPAEPIVLDYIREGTEPSGSNSTKPTPSAVDQMIAMTKTSAEAAEEARRAAEEAARNAAAAEPAAQRAEEAADRASQEAEKVAANAETLITAKVEEAVSRRTPIAILDITIPAEGWKAEEGEDVYPLYIDVPCDIARAVHFPEIALYRASLSTAMVVGLCPTVTALDGSIRFWAEAQPAADMTATVALLTASTGTPSSGGTTPGDAASDEEVTEAISDIFGESAVNE